MSGKLSLLNTLPLISLGLIQLRKGSKAGLVPGIRRFKTSNIVVLIKVLLEFIGFVWGGGGVMFICGRLR